MVAPHLRSFGRVLVPLVLMVFAVFLASCSGDGTSSAGDTATTISPTTASSVGENTTETDASGVAEPGGSPPAIPPSPPEGSSGPPQLGGDYAERLPQLEQTVEQNPDDLEALGQLAIGYFQTQAYPKAEETYKKMLAIKDAAETHNNLGNVYRDWNKTEQAIEEYEKALDLDPSLGVAYGNLAALHMMTGNADEAIRVAEDGVEKTSGPAREQLQGLLDSLR